MLYVDLFESEAIAKFAYDLGTRRLVIFFQSGGVYEYQGVPRTVFDGFRAAQSKGEFFQSAVRSQFTSQRLSPSEVEGIERSPGRAGTGGATNVIWSTSPASAGPGSAGIFERKRTVTGRDAPPRRGAPRTRAMRKGLQSA
jgi:hypothetical protein